MHITYHFPSTTLFRSIHEAQQRYFQSMFVWWPPEGRGFKIPIFPGGHLIGAGLLINLIAAHAKRFRWAWRKLGIHLTDRKSTRLNSSQTVISYAVFCL